jgi:hypothetical protein
MLVPCTDIPILVLVNSEHSFQHQIGIALTKRITPSYEDIYPLVRGFWPDRMKGKAYVWNHANTKKSRLAQLEHSGFFSYKFLTSLHLFARECCKGYVIDKFLDEMILFYKKNYNVKEKLQK